MGQEAGYPPVRKGEGAAVLNSPPPLTKGCGRRRVAAISGVRIATYATRSDSVPGWRCVEGRAALVRGGVLLWVGVGVSSGRYGCEEVVVTQKGVSRGGLWRTVEGQRVRDEDGKKIWG